MTSLAVAVEVDLDLSSTTFTPLTDLQHDNSEQLQQQRRGRWNTGISYIHPCTSPDSSVVPSPSDAFTRYAVHLGRRGGCRGPGCSGGRRGSGEEISGGLVRLDARSRCQSIVSPFTCLAGDVAADRGGGVEYPSNCNTGLSLGRIRPLARHVPTSRYVCPVSFTLPYPTPLGRYAHADLDTSQKVPGEPDPPIAQSLFSPHALPRAFELRRPVRQQSTAHHGEKVGCVAGRYRSGTRWQPHIAGRRRTGDRTVLPHHSHTMHLVYPLTLGPSRWCELDGGHMIKSKRCIVPLLID